MSAVPRIRRCRFWHRRHQPFLCRRKSQWFPPIHRQPFVVNDGPAAPVPKSDVTDGEQSMSLFDETPVEVKDVVTPTPHSSDSSSDEPTTVKKRPHQRSRTGSDAGDDFLEPEKAMRSKFRPDVTKAQNGCIGVSAPADAGTCQQLSSPPAVLTNGVKQQDTDSDAMSDMDEAMPEPMSPEYDLKVITADDETGLIVVDPRVFHSDEAHVTLVSGCVTLRLVHGNMQLNGYEMRTHRPVKTCTAGSRDFVLISGTEFSSSPEQVSQAIRVALEPKYAEKVIREIRTFSHFPHLTVVLVKKWDEERIALIRANAAYRMPDPKTASSGSLFHLTFSRNFSSMRKEWMPLIQDQVLGPINDQSVLVIAGPSDSGKSVLMRRIVNTIMSVEGNYGLKDRVIVLDLDPGQSEFSPPGQLTAVSVRFDDEPLLSRPFVHSVLYSDRVICGVSVGSTDISACASVFIRGVRHIMHLIRETHSKDGSCAVIVNTSGFVRGLGRSILIDVIRIIRPTALIEIKESLDSGNDCRPDVVNGPRAFGFATDATSDPENPSYSFIDLKSSGSRQRHIVINQRNRESQILAALSRNPDLLMMPFHSLNTIPVDLNQVIHFTNPVCFSVPIVMDKLHRSFVQLVRVETDESPASRTRGICQTIDLRNNRILGYGILLLSRTSESEVQLSVAASNDDVHEANCIVIPGGISLPVSLNV